jgi:hypothetical protein
VALSSSSFFSLQQELDLLREQQQAKLAEARAAGKAEGTAALAAASEEAKKLRLQIDKCVCRRFARVGGENKSQSPCLP